MSNIVGVEVETTDGFAPDREPLSPLGQQAVELTAVLTDDDASLKAVVLALLEIADAIRNGC
jgi:hypothetical protein